MQGSLARLYKQHNSVGSELHCTGIGIDIRLAQVQTHAKTGTHTRQTTHTPGKGRTKIRGRETKIIGRIQYVLESDLSAWIIARRNIMELLEHGLYKSGKKERNLHCPVVRERQTKQIDGRKKSLKFCLFIIRYR
jgi:hypothetical protein